MSPAVNRLPRGLAVTSLAFLSLTSAPSTLAAAAPGGPFPTAGAGAIRSSAEPGGCPDSSANEPDARPARGSRPVLFDELIRPLVDAAAGRRADLARRDAQYEHRVDADLNSRRLNVALLGYGEEHDQAYADMGVSVTILSLNLDTWDMVSISLSRDIRAPELEDRSVQEPPRWPMTLRDAYRARGFDGIRPIVEEATGLSIDFQVVMRDVFLRNYLDDVSGPVELIVPKDFHSGPYRLDGRSHDPDYIPAGRQVLSTDKAMTFVLGEEVDPQGKDDERSYRKNMLLETLSCQVRQRFAERDTGFALNLLRFSLGELKNQNLLTDFDFQLIAGGLGHIAEAFFGGHGDVDPTFPRLSATRQIVVHDPYFGDGGVRRVHQIAAVPDDQGIPDHPLVKEEVGIGSLGSYMLIPFGGNPYAADLVADYWGAVRGLVKAAVTSQAIDRQVSTILPGLGDIASSKRSSR